jgi:hypothetical protein
MIPEDIRKLVAEQLDIELVGDCRGPMKILRETGRTKADVVILAQEGTDDEPGLCSQLLAVYPDLTIVSVTKDITHAYTQQLCARRLSVSASECGDIIQILRKAVEDPCGDN